MVLCEDGWWGLKRLKICVFWLRVVFSGPVSRFSSGRGVGLCVFV